MADDEKNPITDAPKASPAPTVAAASPDAAASNTRGNEAFGSGAPSFAGFPQTKYHPVYGARAVNDPNEAATIFQPPHNWFDTAAEADAHRTDREAQEVIHYNTRLKVDANVALNNGGEAIPLTGDDAAKGIVRNSVAAQESIDAGNAEPI